MPRWADLLYRALLLAYPGRFRRRYGNEMRLLFAERYRDARGRDSAGVSLWIATLRDVVSGGAGERGTRIFGRRNSTPGFPTRPGDFMGPLRFNLRHAIRSLRSTPSLTLMAILMLGLGIGATTAVFSVADAVILRPLPYPDAHRLVSVYSTEDGAPDNVSGADFMDWRAQQKSFSALAGYRRKRVSVRSDGGEPEMLMGASVTPEFFAAFGLDATLGRTLGPATDGPEQARTAVLSYGLWQTRYEGDATALGTVIYVDEQEFTVVGVMPAGFDFPADTTRIWMSSRYRVPEPPFDLGADPAEVRSAEYFDVVGRLAAGVDLETARAEMHVIGERIATAQPDSENERVEVLPLHDLVVGDSREPLALLSGAVALVLLIACANVANLLLVRSSGRHREIALHRALGADRRRIAWQILTESVLVAALGGALGLVLAAVGTDALIAMAPADLPRIDDAGIDVRVLGFAAAVVLTTGVLCGLAPLPHLLRTDLQAALREGDKNRLGGGQSALRKALVVAEVAISLLLLIGAGLMIRTLLNVIAVDPGFSTQNTVAAHVALDADRYPTRTWRSTPTATRPTRRSARSTLRRSLDCAAWRRSSRRVEC